MKRKDGKEKVDVEKGLGLDLGMTLY